MSETPSADPPPPPRRPPSRGRVVLTGVALGAAWGFVMWGIAELAGRDSGLSGLGYLVLTVGMLGGGVAAVFGTVAGVRRGRGN